MEHKQNIKVTLHVKEIIFDIMNKTHLTGHAREAEGKKNYEAASYMQASEDDEASYQVRREVSNAFAAIKVRLGEYLDENKTATNNRIATYVDNIDLDDDEALDTLVAAIDDVTADNTDAHLKLIKEEADDSATTLSKLLGVIANNVDDIKDTNAVQKEAIQKAVDSIKSELELHFLMPSNFHNAAIDSLGSACHQFIVNKSIAAWFVITNPEEAQTYTNLAEEALDTAKRALYKRARPVRPTYTA